MDQICNGHWWAVVLAKITGISIATSYSKNELQPTALEGSREFLYMYRAKANSTKASKVIKPELRALCLVGVYPSLKKLNDLGQAHGSFFYCVAKKHPRYRPCVDFITSLNILDIVNLIIYQETDH